MIKPGLRATLILAMALLAAGAAVVVLGFPGLLPGSGFGATPTVPPMFSATAPFAPTATEPILPPPPTSALASPAILGKPVSPTTSELPATAVPSRAATSFPEPLPAPRPTPSSFYTLGQRMCVGGSGGLLRQGLADQLGLGAYLDWGADPGGSRSVDVEYMPMVRLKGGKARPDGQELLSVVDALPGALWLIGNEPDVKWQDNVAPDRYAELYHELYYLIKGRDPTSQVAIGGVSQPTPLRLRYLDLILESYKGRYGEPMPVDVWNVHNFVLREERDSWGVDIPPSMTEDAGTLREIADHDDLAIFQQQIVAFRRWLAERGQQDKPLIVTEYGILMPPDYGFPPDGVESFMLGSFSYLSTAVDSAVGYPADGYRLVQRWCWFSLADERYPAGNLVDKGSGQLTVLGQAFRNFAAMME